MHKIFFFLFILLRVVLENLFAPNWNEPKQEKYTEKKTTTELQ